MKCPELLSKIDELSGRYLNVLEDVCNLESPTAEKELVDAVGAYIACWAKELGLDVEIAPMENAGDPLCITLNPEAKAAPVVLSGHIDTVHPVGLFPKPACHRDEKNMYGPGTIDCKGGVVASMLAMDALKQCGFTARPVKLIVQTDEETSSKNSGKKTIEFMIERSRDAVAFLNTEGHSAGQVIMQRKGIVRYRFHVTGKAAHSASCYEGINAVAEAAQKLLRLERFKDPVGITCNCGVISGGTVGNTVAEKCSFIADFRYATPEQYNEVLAAVKEASETCYLEGSTCEVELVSARPPLVRCERNDQLLARMNELYAENGMIRQKAATSRGGSDAAYTTEAGIPTVDDVGVRGGRGHSIEEYMVLDSLAESAKLQAVVAYGI